MPRAFLNHLNQTQPLGMGSSLIPTLQVGLLRPGEARDLPREVGELDWNLALARKAELGVRPASSGGSWRDPEVRCPCAW